MTYNVFSGKLNPAQPVSVAAVCALTCSLRSK